MGARESESVPVIAPVPGIVAKVSVAEGSSVSEGQTIVVLQSMKTEIHVVAEVHGRVRKLHVKEGQEVNLGQPVADLEPQ